MIAKRFPNCERLFEYKNIGCLSTGTWKKLENDFSIFWIDRHTKFITNGRLDKLIEGKDLNYWQKKIMIWF
jgi:hypothetical protein